MKVVSFILSLVAICSSSFIKSHYSLNQGNGILKQTNIEPYSHNSHPYIPGFSYSYGYVDANRIAIANKKTGYFYYDMDVYFTDFTSVSRLFLIRVKVDFTPGCEAYDNGNKEFDSRFSLYKGYIHINLYQKLDLYAQSSSIAVKQGWPQSSNFTSTVTSSYGSSINLNATLGAGVSLTEGLSAKAQAGVGLSLSFNKSIAVTGPEPSISYQRGDSVKDMQWNYEYAEQGNNTYSLETYYLFEAKNNGIGYQDYSFGFDVEIHMDNVAYRHYWWEQHEEIDYHVSEEYGLYK